MGEIFGREFDDLCRLRKELRQSLVHKMVDDPKYALLVAWLEALARCHFLHQEATSFSKRCSKRGRWPKNHGATEVFFGVQRGNWKYLCVPSIVEINKAPSLFARIRLPLCAIA